MLHVIQFIRNSPKLHQLLVLLLQIITHVSDYLIVVGNLLLKPLHFGLQNMDIF